jgi:hypothetical protein
VNSEDNVDDVIEIIVSLGAKLVEEFISLGVYRPKPGKDG